MAEWVETLHDNVLTCIAMVRGYNLTVIGAGDLWVWFIDLNERNITTSSNDATGRYGQSARSATNTSGSSATGPNRVTSVAKSCRR